MKLVTYKAGKELRIGVVRGQNIVDAHKAAEAVDKKHLHASPKWRARVEELKAKHAGRSDADAGLDLMWSHMTTALDAGKDWLEILDTITGKLLNRLCPKELPEDVFVPLSSVKLRAPIAHPGKIICIGLNYADHAREQGIEPPSAPIFFLKSWNTICGPGDPIVLPPNSTQVDYEAELAVVIGKGGKNIPEEKAMDHVAGYMILNDVSARDMQFGDKQWYRGKSCDTFAPNGPWIVTKDEVPDPHNLRISLTLNGQTMQDSNTSNLIFKIPYLISYLSQSVTWEAGDIISTGTPPGVGVFRKPPVFLKAGDEVSVTIERLGNLSNPVASH